MGEERRRQIVGLLKGSDRPITGGELAARLKVSRQVIVQDVAVLRAKGEGIIATPQGYMLLSGGTARPAYAAVLACQHSLEQAEEELTILVDHGVKVVDVAVEHPIYGELRGLLMLESRRDVKDFLTRLAETDAALLSSLTKGVHLHTVECSRDTALRRAIEALKAKGFLLAD